MSGWATGYCNTGDANIHYRRTGGSKPPLVLLHGLAADGTCWSHLARCLQEEFDVVIPDARGHGRSSTPVEGYRYEHHARDTLTLIESLGLVTPAVLGHSMGGMTAALVASQRADLISTVILADPTFLAPQRQREVFAGEVVEQHRRLLDRSPEDLMAEWSLRHPQRSSDMIGLLAAARLRTRIEAFAVLEPPNPDFRQLVSSIQAPLLMVLGDDPVVSIETAIELQQVNPPLRLKQIRNAGHGLPYDQPDQFAAAVRSFLIRSADPAASQRETRLPRTIR